MSAIVVLKEAGTLVLGTDSRFLKHDFSGVASDSTQKIHRIAEGAYIATSGWAMACDFQPQKPKSKAKPKRLSPARVVNRHQLVLWCEVEDCQWHTVPADFKAAHEKECREQARAAGWKFGSVRARCPEHQKQRSAPPRISRPAGEPSGVEGERDVEA